MMIEKNLESICENIFDVIAETGFHESAKYELKWLLQDTHISVDKSKGLIEIEDELEPEHVIEIRFSKVERRVDE